MGLEAPYVGNAPEPDERVSRRDLNILLDTSEEALGYADEISAWAGRLDDSSLDENVNTKALITALEDFARQVGNAAAEAEGNGVYDDE